MNELNAIVLTAFDPAMEKFWRLILAGRAEFKHDAVTEVFWLEITAERVAAEVAQSKRTITIECKMDKIPDI